MKRKILKRAMLMAACAAGCCVVGHALATMQRGYIAWGGELVFLMAIPLGMSLLEDKS